MVAAGDGNICGSGKLRRISHQIASIADIEFAVNIPEIKIVPCQERNTVDSFFSVHLFR